jgi:hypothetical protein
MLKLVKIVSVTGVLYQVNSSYIVGFSTEANTTTTKIGGVEITEPFYAVKVANYGQPIYVYKEELDRLYRRLTELYDVEE